MDGAVQRDKVLISRAQRLKTPKQNLKCIVNRERGGAARGVSLSIIQICESSLQTVDAIRQLRKQQQQQQVLPNGVARYISWSQVTIGREFITKLRESANRQFKYFYTCQLKLF